MGNDLGSLTGDPSQMGKAMIISSGRRIQVSNLPQAAGLDGKTLAEFLNKVMLAAKLTIEGGDCVTDVLMNMDGQMAYVDFRSPEETSNSLTLDGIQLHGQSLKLSRPPEFAAPMIPALMPGRLPPSAMSVGGMMAMPGSMSTVPGIAQMLRPGMSFGIPPPPPAPGILGGVMNVPGLSATRTAMATTRLARRVRFANLPIADNITNQTVIDFVNMAMRNMKKAVKGGSCVIDCLRAGKGEFALVEFRTLAEASGAMSLHGTLFEGKPVYVSRLDGFSDPPLDVIQRLIGTGIVGSPGDLASVPEMCVLTMNPTRVLVLTNTLTLEDLNDQEELQDIMDDTHEKCEQDFGKVSSMIAVDPRVCAVDPCLKDFLTKVVIEFESPDFALKAQKGLDKQKFCDRVVSALFMHEDNFAIVKTAYNLAKAFDPQKQKE